MHRSTLSSYQNVLVIPLGRACCIVPDKTLAGDFRGLCARNPVCCPLIGETVPGNPELPASIAQDADVRTDAPSYNLYQDGTFIRAVGDITDYWKPDSVAFFIGCSYSFESALAAVGLEPRHVTNRGVVSMYRTSVPLCASGVFRSTMIVSMRPYKKSDVERVRDVTRPFRGTHGEPIDWGFDACARLGISNLNAPDFGSAVALYDDEVPVFWGCGVTPQEAVMQSAIPGLIIGHTPGMMLCIDLLDKDVCLE